MLILIMKYMTNNTILLYKNVANNTISIVQELHPFP